MDVVVRVRAVLTVNENYLFTNRAFSVIHFATMWTNAVKLPMTVCQFGSPPFNILGYISQKRKEKFDTVKDLVKEVAKDIRKDLFEGIPKDIRKGIPKGRFKDIVKREI
ncbi:hypothetical protein [Alicyclobacillus sp. SO9]|uniref:hypothetical protein n=1 Tax=Alicyclobacillus sp. SO9 TaxID=2665646 RepID=UPI0018E719FF|nr:hypothetical protein [Alicyclobacillus sp. SO9]